MRLTSRGVTERERFDMTDSKPCTKCKQTFPRTPEYFHRHKKTKDGLSQRCKACRIADNDAYKKANPEKVRESNRKYNANNPEKRRDQEKRKPSRQPERMQAYRRDYYLKTAEKQKAHGREWRKNNPEKRRMQERKRRALEYNAISEPYTTQDVLNRYGTNCRYCYEPINFDAPRIVGTPGWELGLHLDHVIPLSKNGTDTLDNVEPAHALCNMRRFNL